MSNCQSTIGANYFLDRVFPEVLLLPFPLRRRNCLRLVPGQGCSADICTRRLASIRRRAGMPAVNRQARCGAVSFIHRFGPVEHECAAKPISLGLAYDVT